MVCQVEVSIQVNDASQVILGKVDNKFIFSLQAH